MAGQLFTSEIKINVSIGNVDTSAIEKAVQQSISRATGNIPVTVETPKGPGTVGIEPKGSLRYQKEFSDAMAKSASKLNEAVIGMGKAQTVTQKNSVIQERIRASQTELERRAPASQMNLAGSEARGSRYGTAGRLRSVFEYRVAAQLTELPFKAFGKAVGTIADVNKEITQLNKLLDTSKAKLDDLKTSAVATAKEYGLSTKEVLQGYKIFAQQGLAPADVKQFGRTVALASNVSEFGTAGLSELIVATKKLFPEKETGKTGQKLIDTLLKVEGKYAVSESDLADVIKRIGAQAAVAGMSIPELSALTTVLKERTRAPSGEIATSLRFMIKNLQDPKTTTALTKAFDRFGQQNKVRFYDATGDLRNTFDVLRDISEVFPRLNRAQKTYIAGQIGETRFASKVLALLGGFSQTTDVLNVAQTAQGTTLERNAIVMESLEKQSKKTGAAFEGFALAFGENFVQPALTFLKITQEALNLLERGAKLRLFGGEQKEPGIGQKEVPSAGGIPVGAIASTLIGYTALRMAGRGLTKGIEFARLVPDITKAVASSFKVPLNNMAAVTAAESIAASTLSATLTKVPVIPGLSGSLRRSMALTKLGQAAEGTIGNTTMYASLERGGSPSLRQATALSKLEKAAIGTINEGRVIVNEFGTTYREIGKNLLQPGIELGAKAPEFGTVAKAGIGGAAVALGGAGIAAAASSTSKGLKIAGNAGELLGHTFSTATALVATSVKTLPKMLWSIFGSGSAFTKMFAGIGGFLATRGGAGILGTAARGVGGFLGAGAGPLGIVASMAAVEAAIWGIGRIFESGRGRSERQGLIQRQDTAQQALNLSYNLESGFNDLTSVNEQISKSSKMSADEQREAIKKGELDGNTKELIKTRDDLVKSQKVSLMEYAKIIKATPALQQQFEVTPGGNIKFFEDALRTKPGVDLREADTKTFKTAIGMVKTVSEFDRAIAGTGTALNSLSENLENDESFKLFDKAYEKARRRAEEFKLPGLDISTEDIPKLWRFRGTAPSIPGLTPEEMKVLTERPALREGAVGGILKGFEQIIARAPTGEKALEGITEVIKGAKPENIDKLLKSVDVNNKLAQKVQIPKEQQGVFTAPRDLQQDLIEVLKKDPQRAAKFIAEELTPIMAESFKGGETKNIEGFNNIVQELRSVQEGTAIKFKDQRGINQIGSVIDVNNQRIVRTIEKADQFTATGKVETGIKFIDKPLEEFGKLINRVTLVSRPTSALTEAEIGITEKTLLTGIGARRLEETGMKGGAAYLSELTDLMAGLFTGYKQGTPAFNKELQDIFSTTSKNMEGIAAALKEKKPLSIDQKQQLVDFEAVSLVAKEIESLGKIIKTLEGTFVKFQQVENQRVAQREIPVTTTGELRTFGGAVPKVEFGKDLIDLSPLERAANMLPNLFDNLSRNQTQLGLLNKAYEDSLNIQDTAIQALETTSPQALETLNVEGLKELLASGGVSQADKTTGIDILNKLTGIKDISPERQAGLLTNAKDFFIPLLKSIPEKIKTQAGRITEETRPLEIAAKTASSLAALQIGAETAARSLESLKKFDNTFKNLQRARGQGAFGLLGPGEAPQYFANRPGAKMDRAEEFSFIGKDRFRMRREMIDLLSTPKVQRGQTEIVDITGQKQAPLSRQQAETAKFFLSAEERRAKITETEGTRRGRLEEVEKSLTQTRNAIFQTLTTRPELMPETRQELTGLMDEINSIGKLKPERFVGKQGEKALSSLEDYVTNLPEKFGQMYGADVAGKTAEQAKREFQVATQKMMVTAGTVNIEGAKIPGAGIGVSAAAEKPGMIGQMTGKAMDYATNMGGKAYDYLSGLTTDWMKSWGLDTGTSVGKSVTDTMAGLGYSPQEQNIENKAGTEQQQQKDRIPFYAIRGALSPEIAQTIGTGKFIKETGQFTKEAYKPYISPYETGEVLNTGGSIAEVTKRLKGFDSMYAGDTLYSGRFAELPLRSYSNLKPNGEDTNLAGFYNRKDYSKNFLDIYNREQQMAPKIGAPDYSPYYKEKKTAATVESLGDTTDKSTTLMDSLQNTIKDMVSGLTSAGKEVGSVIKSSFETGARTVSDLLGATFTEGSRKVETANKETNGIGKTADIMTLKDSFAALVEQNNIIAAQQAEQEEYTKREWAIWANNLRLTTDEVESLKTNVSSYPTREELNAAIGEVIAIQNRNLETGDSADVQVASINVELIKLKSDLNTLDARMSILTKGSVF